MIIFNYGEWLGIKSDIEDVSECNIDPFKYKCPLTDCSITKSALELLLDSEEDDFSSPILDFVNISGEPYIAWIEQPCIAFTPHGMMKVFNKDLIKIPIAEDIKIPQDFLEYIGVNN